LTNDLDLSIKTTKRSIKERFGSMKIKKDGTPGKILVVPPLDDLQRHEEYVTDWIDYSTFDSEATWYLLLKMQGLLAGKSKN